MIELIGKKVCITKTDKFRKYGILLGFDSNFIKVQFDNGIVHFIPLEGVAEIAEARG